MWRRGGTLILCITSERVLAVVPVEALIPVRKTIKTGIGSKIIGADIGAHLYGRPSGRGQDLDR